MIGILIHEKLINYAPLNDIIEGRISPLISDDKSKLPYIVYGIRIGPPEYAKIGIKNSGIVDSIDIVLEITSDSYKILQNVMGKIRLAIENQTLSFNGVESRTVSLRSQEEYFEKKSRNYNGTMLFSVRTNLMVDESNVVEEVIVNPDNLPPNIVNNENIINYIKKGEQYILNLVSFVNVNTWTVDTMIDGLTINNSGLLFGIVSGLDRQETMSITATNQYGTDTVNLIFDISDNGIVEDPLTADANTNYTGSPSAENSDNIGLYLDVPTLSLNNGTPYPVKEEGKIFFVRIGVPYLFQFSIDPNGVDPNITRVTSVSNIFDNAKFFPAISRIYGIPTGIPRTESIDVTVTNQNGTNTETFDFELIEDVGIDILLAPYNFRAINIDKQDNSFTLLWNSREYSGFISSFEIYRDNSYYRTITVTQDGKLSHNSGLFQVQYTMNNWKVRAVDSLGNYSEFSEEIIVDMV
tara:strand:+ start:9599 stop:10999 length:1401 start_codon:yes stop_codon:yes gene_type:complete